MGLIYVVQHRLEEILFVGMGRNVVVLVIIVLDVMILKRNIVVDFIRVVFLMIVVPFVLWKVKIVMIRGRVFVVLMVGHTGRVIKVKNVIILELVFKLF